MLQPHVQGPYDLASAYVSSLGSGVPPLTLIPRLTLCQETLAAPSLPAVLLILSTAPSLTCPNPCLLLLPVSPTVFSTFSIFTSPRL